MREQKSKRNTLVDKKLVLEMNDGSYQKMKGEKMDSFNQYILASLDCLH